MMAMAGYGTGAWYPVGTSILAAFTDFLFQDDVPLMVIAPLTGSAELNLLLLRQLR